MVFEIVLKQRAGMRDRKRQSAIFRESAKREMAAGNFCFPAGSHAPKPSFMARWDCRGELPEKCFGSRF